MVKKSVFALVFVFLIALASSVEAARYVKSSGGISPSDSYGTNCGTDWNNACSRLPDSLYRGETYYIASGNYPGYSFDDAVSGTSVITIKKANATDHGTETGWSSLTSQQRDGQAIFDASGGCSPCGFCTAISFGSGYYVFDGNAGAGSNKAGYGFAINQPNQDSGAKLLWIGQGGASIRDITIKRVAFQCLGAGINREQQAITESSSAWPTNVNIQNNYFDNCGTSIYSAGNNWVIENNYFDRSWSSNTADSCGSEHHGVHIAVDGADPVAFRYNTFAMCAGTTCIESMYANGLHNWDIYGNVFLNSDTSNGVIAAAGNQVIENTRIYNNVIINSADIFLWQSSGASGATGNVVKNNLFYNSNGALGGTGAQIAESNNAYFSSYGYNSGQSGIIVGSVNPFVDSANGDYRLKAGSSAINAGATLSYPNIDRAGNTFGADGRWDIGAYEYIVVGPANGVCGTTLDSCSSGQFSQVADTTTQYLWRCLGTGGSTVNADCSMNIPSIPGQCGPAAKTYSPSETFPVGAYCNLGNSNPTFPSNPSAGSISSWTCSGLNGGTFASCTATRSNINNLILNGDFESFSNGLATSWNDLSGGSTYTLLQDTGHTGSSQLISVGDFLGWGMIFYQQLTLTVGKQYRWTFWYKTSGTNTINAQIGDTPFDNVVVNQQLAGTNGVWQQAQITFTYNNALANKIRLSPNSAGSYWIDDMILVEATSATNYHPADTNNDLIIMIDEYTGYRNAWRGQLNWPIAPSPPSDDYHSRALFLWKTGESYVINSSTSCPPDLPYNCWIK